MLPELSRRYGLTPRDLDDLTIAEADVYREHLEATFAAEQAEREAAEKAAEEQRRQIEELQRRMAANGQR